MSKISFFGAGKMGGALIKGIIKKEMILPKDIYVFDPDKEKTQKLSREYGIHALESAKQAANMADFLFLCVKPQIMDSLIDDISDKLKADAVLISIAAGIPVKRIKDRLKNDHSVIRCMPNTPALIGQGMTVICADGSNDKEKTDKVISLFEAVGKTQLLPESLMNEVISLTGSSPSYIYMLIGAMAKGAISQGIPEDIVYTLAAQTVLGSAKMVIETKRLPKELTSDVCAPGGTTIEAVSKLKEMGFEEAVIKAMDACTDKAYLLGGQERKKI